MGTGNDAEPLRSLERRLSPDVPEVLDAVPMVLARRFGEGGFQSGERHVLGAVADGMDPELPAGLVGAPHLRRENRVFAHEQTRLVRPVARRGRPRAVDKNLDGADAKPVVAEARAQPGGEESIEVGERLVPGRDGESELQANRQLTSLLEILVGPDAPRRCRQLVGSSDALLEKHLLQRSPQRFAQS